MASWATLRGLAAVAIAIFLLPSGTAGAATAERPNIIVILADDLGFNDISLNGNPLVATPNIDAIAHDGVRFISGYSSNAVCAPARAALMTGRFQQRFGFESTPPLPAFRKAFDGTYPTEDIAVLLPTPDEMPNPMEVGFPADEITLAESLKAEGYRTAIIGKWHLGLGPDFQPLKHGFDEFVGLPGGAALFAEIDDPNIVNARLPWSGIDQYLWAHLPFRVSRNGEAETPDKYMTYFFADEANAFIERNKEEPFFLYLSFNAPHTPLQAPKDVYDRLTHIKDHKKRVYYAMVEAMDAAVGQVMAKLDEAGLTENTLVIFSSDNGGAWYTHIPEHNLPFRGSKATFFEGGVNVPFLMKWPAKLKPGTLAAGPASHLDIFPTAVRAAGGALPDDRTIDGIDLMEAFQGKKEMLTERTLFWRTGGYYAYRQGRYKLQISDIPEKVWLFDLQEDPAERDDRSGLMPDKVTSMRADLEALDAEMADPMWPRTRRIRIYVDGYVRPRPEDAEYITF